MKMHIDEVRKLINKDQAFGDPFPKVGILALSQHCRKTHPILLETLKYVLENHHEGEAFDTKIKEAVEAASYMEVSE